MLHITEERLQGAKPYGVDQAEQYLPHLQAALEIALAEATGWATAGYGNAT